MRQRATFRPATGRPLSKTTPVTIDLTIDDERDINDGEGEMPRPQRPAAMAAQASDKLEDRAAIPDIIYATTAVIPKKSSRAAATKMER
jgi:hypothetical protein